MEWLLKLKEGKKTVQLTNVCIKIIHNGTL